MVQMTRTSSFRRAGNMLKRMALGTVGKTDSVASESSSSEQSDTEEATEEATFISGLTDTIPDMRDDSVLLQMSKPTVPPPCMKMPHPKSKPPLPPKAPEPIEMEIKAKKQSHKPPKIEPRTPPPSLQTPSIQTAKSEGAKPNMMALTMLTSPKQAPPKPVPLDPKQFSLSACATTLPAPKAPVVENANFVKAKLDSVPSLLMEEILSSNSSIVEDAIDRLARRCRKSDEIREEAYRAGGHAIVVMTMRTWRNNEVIQAGGCRCITNMCCQFPEAKRSFALIGGVESAIVAMRAFPHSSQVQAYGCGALMNVMCGHNEETADVGLTMADRFVNTLDGIRLVVKAMTRFPKDNKIQLGGCALFQSLAQNKSFIYSMMQEGAVAAVGSSLTSHPDDPNIKKAAGSFMKKVFA